MRDSSVVCPLCGEKLRGGQLVDFEWELMRKWAVFVDVWKGGKAVCVLVCYSKKFCYRDCS